MKFNYIFILLILFTTSCKAQLNKLSEIKSSDLPAYLSATNEKKVINSIINSSQFYKFQQVLYNNKEYSIKEAQRILDTIGNDYTFDIKIDSLKNKKILFIKKNTCPK